MPSSGSGWTTQLSAAARAVIIDPANEVLVSPVTYWELAIKIGIGKYSLLLIEPRHSAALIGLPFHHRDPFDRLLVAQSIVENIPLVTCDPALAPYPIARVW